MVRVGRSEGFAENADTIVLALVRPLKRAMDCCRESEVEVRRARQPCESYTWLRTIKVTDSKRDADGATFDSHR
jgi:hypothetical protein